MKNEYVFLFEEIRRMAQECGSRYRGLRVNKDDIYEFLEYNNWFGMEQKGEGDDIEVVMNQKAEEAIMLWLRAYKQPPEIRTGLLLGHFKDRYPRTVEALEGFIDADEVRDKAYVWQALDFLFYGISTDDDVFEDAATQKLLKMGLDELSVIAGEFIIGFIVSLDKQASRWEYRHEKRKLSDTGGAYGFNAFAVMAHEVFNSDSWKEHDLIRKAVADTRYAELWLWVALHFISALRTSDMKRLPVPKVADRRDGIISRLITDDYTDMALSVAYQWQMQLHMEEITPSKTSRHRGIPNIKIFIPESLKLPIGVILLTVLIHHVENDALLTVNNEYYLLKGFFGERFLEACGGRRFSSRRANKAYLQGIESLGRESGGANAKGYMLAALARSHKGGIGSLPETTDVYLRDENFSGYTPEFIIREMFERGIFGFIPVMLLKSYDEENFLKMGVHDQTMLIKEIGLDGFQIEQITGAVDMALLKVRECTRLFMSNSAVSDCREAAERLLEKIAAGIAVSKQPEFFCLRIAAGDRCINADRGTCLGCGYEIYTKAAFYLVVNEFHRLVMARKEATGIDAERYGALLEKVVTPAITQMMASMKALYRSDEEIEVMMDILEGGLIDDSSN